MAGDPFPQSIDLNCIIAEGLRLKEQQRRDREQQRLDEQERYEYLGPTKWFGIGGLVLALIGIIWSTLPSKASIQEMDVTALMGANVRIENNAHKTTCSGSVIDKRRKIILTAYHCIMGDIVPKHGVRTQWVYKNGKAYEAKVVAYDRQGEEALLVVIDPAFKPTIEADLAPANYARRLGQIVYFFSNPHGEPDILTLGIVSSSLRPVNLKDVGLIQAFWSDSAGLPGSSGGAVVDENGRVIGTLSGGEQGFTIFAPSSTAWKLLRKAGLLTNKVA